MLAPPRTNRLSGASLNAPSGIAQLRRTTEQALPQPDPMNLDDFINNDTEGTPAGLALTPTPEAMRQAEEKSAHTTAAAIPIKSRKDPSQQLIPQSVPVVAHQRVQDEFGYLPRHPRKTSIDETGQRVSSVSCFAKQGCLVWMPLSVSYLVSQSVPAYPRR